MNRIKSHTFVSYLIAPPVFCTQSAGKSSKQLHFDGKNGFTLIKHLPSSNILLIRKILDKIKLFHSLEQANFIRNSPSRMDPSRTHAKTRYSLRKVGGPKPIPRPLSLRSFWSVWQISSRLPSGIFVNLDSNPGFIPNPRSIHKERVISDVNLGNLQGAERSIRWQGRF